MRTVRLAAACALALLASCTLPRPYGDTVDLQTLLGYGYRAVQGTSDFDGHPSYSVALATRDPAVGWGYELGGSYGKEDVGQGAATHTGEFDEVWFGLRRTHGGEDDATRPYFGFGGAVTRLEHGLEAPERGFDDHGAGVYACAGVLWDMGRIFFDPGAEVLIGVDLRALLGDDYDYEQLGLTLAFGL